MLPSAIAETGNLGHDASGLETPGSDAQAEAGPACLYLLADHLDALLAAGEDLLRIDVTAPMTTADAEIACHDGVRAAVERVRVLELAMLGRILKARERASELAALDARFAMPARLFVGGTGALIDAIADCADTSTVDFETGDALPAYLRSRGLIDARKCSLLAGEGFAVGEDFLLAARIPLGALLDMVASFLDTLELHYALYAPEAGAAASTSAALA